MDFNDFLFPFCIPRLLWVLILLCYNEDFERFCLEEWREIESQRKYRNSPILL